MPKSVLEAIKLGFWDYEPPEVEFSQYDAADAMPGTGEKLRVMAHRLRLGAVVAQGRPRGHGSPAAAQKSPADATVMPGT